MSDNLQIKDGLGDLQTVRTKDVGTSSASLHVPGHTPFDQFGEPLFSNTSPGVTTELTTVIAQSMLRPASAATYNLGQLVANALSAASVVPIALPVARMQGGNVRLTRGRLIKSTTGIGDAVFRAHLYSQLPTPANGDTGLWLTNGAAFYCGSFTFDMTSAAGRVFSDGASVIAVPDVGTQQIVTLPITSVYLYALLEARAAYAAAASESFTLSLEVAQD